MNQRPLRITLPGVQWVATFLRTALLMLDFEGASFALDRPMPSAATGLPLDSAPQTTQRLSGLALLPEGQAQWIEWGDLHSSPLPFNTPVPLHPVARSGLPVSLSLASGPGQLIGTNLVVTNSGPVVLVAEQAGNNEWAPASSTNTVWAFDSAFEQVFRWHDVTRGGITAVEARNGFAYLLLDSGFLVILDVSDNAFPTEIASVRVEGIGLAVHQNHAYIPGYGSLGIVDVGDPKQPRLLPPLQISTHYARIQDIQVENGRGYFLRHAQFEVFEVNAGGTPANPDVPRSYQSANPFYTGFAVEGNYAYLANFREGLEIVRLDETNAPSLFAAYPAPSAGDERKGVHSVQGFQRDFVFGEGNYAYMADGLPGVRIFDLTDPAKPLLVATAQTAGQPWQLAFAGNRLYVTHLEHDPPIFTFVCFVCPKSPLAWKYR